MELVFYDEVEYFRSYDSNQFDYPYMDRKSVIKSYKFNMSKGKDDYSYPVNTLKMFKSKICLEDPYFMQLFFLVDTVNAIMSQAKSILGI